jgi:ferritin
MKSLKLTNNKELVDRLRTFCSNNDRRMKAFNEMLSDGSIALMGTPIESSPEIVDRRVTTLTPTTGRMLVEQLAHELTNHNIYRTFASYFGMEDLTDLEEYFLARAAEEYHHHEWIYKYLSDRGFKFQYPAIPPVNYDILSRITPFELTVEIEINTTQLIDRIVEQAMIEKDWATLQWLMSDDNDKGMLVKEQIEEESISRTILGLAQKHTDWVTKAEEILDEYKESQGTECD